ncbi:hypothetical protein NKJ90_11015 [Mesorhizobium sp. M0051]|uniref:hypothetical protein n=1 Tax=unclassified Mesorhizobium TaxID=325217 RepID=UPI0012EBB918|nr:hypothetical protein [Mesorhizobium sp. LNHC252B00]
MTDNVEVRSPTPAIGRTQSTGFLAQCGNNIIRACCSRATRLGHSYLLKADGPAFRSLVHRFGNDFCRRFDRAGGSLRGLKCELRWMVLLSRVPRAPDFGGTLCLNNVAARLVLLVGNDDPHASSTTV